MTTDKRTMTTPTQLYRIHWRISTTGATGQSTGLFEKGLAEMWVASLNSDRSNRELGLYHWMQRVQPEKRELDEQRMD